MIFMHEIENIKYVVTEYIKFKKKDTNCILLRLNCHECKIEHCF
jgi:ribosomal protein L44E